MSKPPPPDDLADALNELPLFPLQHVVLFPGALLRLHVFEKRYRTMVRDVVGSHRALSVVNVPDLNAHLAGNPPIAELAGVGTIVEHMELPGGRFNIVLLGRARVRLQELRFRAPYRRALATLVESSGPSASAVDMAALHAAVSSFVTLVRDRDPGFKLRLPKDSSPSGIADVCAAHLVLDARERQRLLETLGERQRVRRLTEILTIQRAALAPARGDGELN
jgi:ATP-dependent Lon protease